jgi:hypothetical protein
MSLICLVFFTKNNKKQSNSPLPENQKPSVSETLECLGKYAKINIKKYEIKIIF